MQPLASENVLNSLVSLLEKQRILHITGDPGTGKSILAQAIAIRFGELRNKQVLYIDTMKKFSKKRFMMFFKDSEKRDLFTMSEIQSLQAQEFLITKLKKMSDFNQLNDIGLIVFDSVSHHLRHELTKGQFNHYVNLINEFHGCQMEPLIRVAVKNDIKIIFVHEMSYKPELGSIPFLLSYFEQIKGIWLPIKKIPREMQDTDCDSKDLTYTDRNEYEEDHDEAEELNEGISDMEKRFPTVYKKLLDTSNYSVRKEYCGETSFYQFESESDCFQTILQIPAFDGETTSDLVQVPFKIGNSGLKFYI
jgi:hypothetical protein